MHLVVFARPLIDGSIEETVAEPIEEKLRSSVSFPVPRVYPCAPRSKSPVKVVLCPWPLSVLLGASGRRPLALSWAPFTLCPLVSDDEWTPTRGLEGGEGGESFASH